MELCCDWGCSPLGSSNVDLIDRSEGLCRSEFALVDNWADYSSINRQDSCSRSTVAKRALVIFAAMFVMMAGCMERDCPKQANQPDCEPKIETLAQVHQSINAETAKNVQVDLSRFFVNDFENTRPLIADRNLDSDLRMPANFLEPHAYTI